MTYGARLGEIVRLERPPTLEVRLLQRALFAVTRLTCDQPNHGMTDPAPASDALIIALQLREKVEYELWHGDRFIPAPPARRGTISLFNLETLPRANLIDPFDCLQLYFPRVALDSFTEEHALSKIDSLQIPPGVSIEDPIVHHLGQALLPALDVPERAQQLFLDSVSLALMSHLVCTYGGGRAPPARRLTGLTPWQERRAKELLMARIDGDVSLDELARECGLSRSHFARAFKLTTGEPAHRWLRAQRIDRARDLLLHPALPIADIARRLGFADQSHFTRVFRSSMGLTPAAWRRLLRR